MPATQAPQPPTIDGIVPDAVKVTKDEPVVNLEAKGETDVSRPNPIEELLGPDVLKKLIESGVRQQIEAMGLTPRQEQKFVTNDGPIVATPTFSHLGHYRNDVSPEIEVQELNMDAEVPQLEPIPGSFIRFRRGHFFATTENQVKQLEWMMNTAEHSHDTTQSLGGNRALYKDDDEKIYYCTAGCSAGEFHSASEARFKAHMRGVHGVEL